MARSSAGTACIPRVRVVTTSTDLLDNASFRPARIIDADVPPSPEIYAIRLRDGSMLPEPFEAILSERFSRLIYIGKATSLKGRMLRNELRGRGHGTFFRSIGAVLEFHPQTGALLNKVNRYNFTFEKSHRDAIVQWINSNLEVSWLTLPISDLASTETELIVEHKPLLNLDGDPLALPALESLRALCRQIALSSDGAIQELS